VSSCLQSSNVTSRKPCKQLFDNEQSRSIDTNMEKVECLPIGKDFDKQNSINCFSEINLPKICMSECVPELIPDSHNMTDRIVCNTPDWSQREISPNETENTQLISLMPRNIPESISYTNMYESFEPWSIHRTPAKLRGIYVWSPFLKHK